MFIPCACVFLVHIFHHNICTIEAYPKQTHTRTQSEQQKSKINKFMLSTQQNTKKTRFIASSKSRSQYTNALCNLFFCWNSTQLHTITSMATDFTFVHYSLNYCYSKLIVTCKITNSVLWFAHLSRAYTRFTLINDWCPIPHIQNNYVECSDNHKNMQILLNIFEIGSFLFGKWKWIYLRNLQVGNEKL